jgi:hypothetical protein
MGRSWPSVIPGQGFSPDMTARQDGYLALRLNNSWQVGGSTKLIEVV